MIRFGYFGDGPWSHRALETLLVDPRFGLAFVVARRDREEPVLRGFAESAGVPFYRPENVNSDAFLTQIQPLAADLLVSMSYDQIFRKRLIDLPKLGLINCHAGALPRYRGRNVLNWAIINGETSFGVSVHYVNAGIDTGDLIRQHHFPIGPDDTYHDVLRRAFPACAETLHTAMVDIAEDRVRRTPQSGPGFYCGQRRDGDEWLDWNWSTARLHDFIRGIAPPAPGARTVLKEGSVQLALTHARRVPGVPSHIGTPGEVVGRRASGIVVKTGDTALEITKVAPVGHGGVLGEPYLPSFRVGTRFFPTSVEAQLARLTRNLMSASTGPS